MKRSEINRLLTEAIAFFERFRFSLPVWAHWPPHRWKKHARFAARIRKLQLGWDVTDFGSGDFYKTGLLLFCMRNGPGQGAAKGKKYAEKIMVVREAQETPLHFHFSKREDIINRGGGNLMVELYNSGKKGSRLMSRVKVRIDEMDVTVAAGKPLLLRPGQSIALPPRLYHRFYGQKGAGPVLCGEVSGINDDRRDNRFYRPLGRFPEIEEDETPLFPLWTEVLG